MKNLNYIFILFIYISILNFYLYVYTAEWTQNYESINTVYFYVGGPLSPEFNSNTELKLLGNPLEICNLPLFHPIVNQIYENIINFKKTRKIFNKNLTNLINLNFGQEEDIIYLKNVINNSNKINNKTNNIIFYGKSNGAATIINFIASCSPNNKIVQNTKAIICESIFDSVPSLMRFRFPFLYKIILKFIEYKTSFKIRGPSPIESIFGISRDMPILLVTFLDNKIIPFQSTINFYKALKNLGFNKTHILILNNSSSLDSKDLYENTIHAFYKYYNLPYITIKAYLGEKFFKEQTQPIWPYL